MINVWSPINSSAPVHWLVGQLAHSVSTPINFSTDTTSCSHIDTTHPQWDLFPTSSSKGLQNQLLLITLSFTLHDKRLLLIQQPQRRFAEALKLRTQIGPGRAQSHLQLSPHPVSTSVASRTAWYRHICLRDSRELGAVLTQSWSHDLVIWQYSFLNKANE